MRKGERWKKDCKEVRGEIKYRILYISGPKTCINCTYRCTYTKSKQTLCAKEVEEVM